jgi:hypothetical protein
MTPTGVLLVVGLALGSLATAPGAAVFNVNRARNLLRKIICSGLRRG